QVAVGLRGKAGHHGLVPAGVQVRPHDVADEVLPRLPGCRVGAGRLTGTWWCRAWHWCHLEIALAALSAKSANARQPAIGRGGKRLGIWQRLSEGSPLRGRRGRSPADPIAGVVERWRAASRGAAVPVPRLRPGELRRGVPSKLPWHRVSSTSLPSAQYLPF